MVAWLDACLTQFGVILDVAMYLTVPVYVVILFTLIKNRKDDLFKHAFFILMINVGIADALKILTFAFGNKLASYGWVPQLFLWVGDGYARWYYVFNFTFGGVQIIGALAIVLNRFTAYIFPLKHNKIWESGRRGLLWFCIVFQWFCGLLSAAPLIPVSFLGFTTTLRDDNKSIALLWKPGDDDYYNSIALYPIKIPLGIAIFALYVIIFCTAFVKQCRHGSAATSVTEKLALKMAVVGLLSTLGLFISQATVALSERIYISAATYWFFYNLGNNLLATVHPYALLAFSKSFRERCKLMMRRGFEKNAGRNTQTGSGMGNFVSRPKNMV